FLRPTISTAIYTLSLHDALPISQIVQTARGTNTAFLFSLQAIPQLMSVGRGFRDELSSAPNTNMLLRTKDEETAQYFLKASARVDRKSTRLNSSHLVISYAVFCL